ncbi:hypothetical protein [Halomarina litorea]|uniref:hypothetical protein n=1 Tax=Halomarina litorea TaxID=2961595 RepID=UPI0020C353A1|nr:hypothetical protein [Halomarina sp. BCD28]
MTVGTLLFVSALLHDPATCLLVETAGARTGFAYDWSTGVLHFGDRYGDGYRCHKQVSASVVGGGYAVASLGVFAAVSEQPSRA